MENKLKKYLTENLEECRYVVAEVNSWDGSLDYLEAHYNDEEFFNTFFYNNVMEAVRAVFYGDYNYNDDYVMFDGYGNLETLSENEYDHLLLDNMDDIVERVITLNEEQGMFEDLLE